MTTLKVVFTLIFFRASTSKKILHRAVSALISKGANIRPFRGCPLNGAVSALISKKPSRYTIYCFLSSILPRIYIAIMANIIVGIMNMTFHVLQRHITKKTASRNEATMITSLLVAVENGI